MSVSQVVGAPTQGGMDALFRHDPALAFSTTRGEDPLQQRRTRARLGCGLRLLGGGHLLVPEFGYETGSTGRMYTHRWRLSRATGAQSLFALGLEGARQEGLLGSPRHRLGLTLTASW